MKKWLFLSLAITLGVLLGKRNTGAGYVYIKEGFKHKHLRVEKGLLASTIHTQRVYWLWLCSNLCQHIWLFILCCKLRQHKVCKPTHVSMSRTYVQLVMLSFPVDPPNTTALWLSILMNVWPTSGGGFSPVVGWTFHSPATTVRE